MCRSATNTALAVARRIRCAGAALRLVAVCAAAIPLSATAADDAAFFSDHIEPLLRKRCYACHSHAAGKMESGLALDWRSGWEQGGDRGPAIVRGDPERSLLLHAVRHSDASLRMPQQKLPDQEISLLQQWIERGAFDPRVAKPAAPASSEWWSLKPLVRPAVPENGCANPIDAFIRERLQREGLTSSSPADRRTLLRRATFDLQGLTPTMEELAEFEADQYPDAPARLVDRLLASPRYGERWARHWLDTVHFADTHGFEHDVFRPNAWRYRDYVIDALNRDVLWSQFIREQLAADAFFPETPSRTPALGFLGAGPYDHSAAVTAPKSFEHLDRDDLVIQTMGAFVSTTAGCARCHAHKFDPITQQDYYALQAVFAGIGKGDVPFDADPQIAGQRQRWRTLKTATEKADHAALLQPENQALLNEWEAVRPGAAVWVPLAVEVFVSSDGATLERREDGSIQSGGTRPDKDTVTITATASLTTITAIRLDVLTDDALPMRGPGRMDNGNLHLSEFELQAFEFGAPKGRKIAVRQATADFNQDGWTIQHALDGKSETAWGIHPAVGAPHHAVFELEAPLPLTPDTKLVCVLKQWHGRGHVIGRFKLSATNAPPLAVIALPAMAQEAAAVPADERTPQQQAGLSAAVLRHRADAELRKLPAPVKVYAAAASAENERGIVRFEAPREIRLLKRGDLNQPADVVPAGALSAVSGLPSRFELPTDAPEAARRAALAEWLADQRNPLTWRSIANRVWHYHFGRGLCDTPNDFGRMGSLPSHPELLDWLACELRDNLGSLKRLHRLICTSETYRQSSARTPELDARDPDNRLLARMSMQRLDADSFRDAVLQVSGRMDFTMGGPGIQHFLTSPGPQLTPVLDYGKFDWDTPGAGRRSIYRVVWRGIPDPLLEALDFPDLGQLAPLRSFSASPVQSLALLNNPFVLHHCQRMAERAEASAPTLPAQIRSAVQWTWLREPSREELDQFVGLATQRGVVAVCRLLLNSNEFLFVD